MTLKRLDHVNVRTHQLDAMVTWYTVVLGMHSGPRPEFPFAGAWMYVGEHAVVHLVAVDGDAGAGSETELKLEHFALTGTDWPAFEAGLKASGTKYFCRPIESLGIVQCNVNDPDGNHIHLDFPVS